MNFYFETGAKYLIDGQVLSKAFFSATESFDLVAILFPDEFLRGQATLSARIIIDGRNAEIDNDRIKLVRFDGGYEVVCIPTPLYLPPSAQPIFQNEFHPHGKTHLLTISVGSHSLISIECNDSIFEKHIPPLVSAHATAIEVDSGALFVIKGEFSSREVLLAVLYNGDYKEILYEIADEIALSPESIDTVQNLQDMREHTLSKSFTFDNDIYRISSEKTVGKPFSCPTALLSYLFVENAVVQDDEGCKSFVSKDLLEDFKYFKDFFGDFKYFTANKFRPLKSNELYFVYDRGKTWETERFVFEISDGVITNVYKD